MKSRNTNVPYSTTTTRVHGDVRPCRRAYGRTFNVERSDFASDRVGVDGTAIRAAVGAAYVADEQVPLFEVRSHDAEPPVVDDAPVLVRQRERVLVEPGHLPSITQHVILAAYTAESSPVPALIWCWSQ